MTQAEIQAEAEKRYPYVEDIVTSKDVDRDIRNGVKRGVFIDGCNFATSRHEEEMKEALELLMDYKADLLFKRSSAGLIAQDEDNLQAINNLINRVKPKQ